MRTKRTWTIALSCHKRVKVKVKQSLNKLRQAPRVLGGQGSQISWQLVHEGGEVVSPTHRQPLSPAEIFLILISFRGWVDPREVLCQRKIPSTPSVIEPATFRLAGQCLNQLHHCVPPMPRKEPTSNTSCLWSISAVKVLQEILWVGNSGLFYVSVTQHGLKPLANENCILTTHVRTRRLLKRWKKRKKGKGRGTCLGCEWM